MLGFYTVAVAAERETPVVASEVEPSAETTAEQGATIEALKDGASVGFGSAGIGFASGLALAYAETAATPLLCTPRPPIDPDHGECWPLLYGAGGFVIGAVAGEIAGASLISSAVDRDHREVLRTSLLVFGVGAAAALVTLPSGDPAPAIGGAVVAVVGIPVAAGIAAGLAPETGYSAMGLVPAVGPHGPGIRLVGRF